MRRAWIGLLLLMLIALAYQRYLNTNKEDSIKPFDPLALAPGAEPAPFQQLSELTQEYGEADLRSAIAIQEAKGDADRLVALHARRDLPEKYVGRFADLAKRYPDDPTAFYSLIWVITHCPLTSEAQTAMQIITRDHLQMDGIAPVCEELAIAPSQLSEALLRALIADNPHPDVRAHARFSLGQLLKGRKDDGSQDEDSPRTREAEALFEQVVADDGGVEIGHLPMATFAKAELFELRDLAIGKPVPEIEGNDLNGRPMTLSSFRGRVVVLEFWGYWCSVCTKNFPHYQALAKKFADKPFVLVGVNSDGNPQAASDTLHDLGLSWPSWPDGGDARGGLIAQRWKCGALPTTFVIDAKGILRYKLGPREDSHDTATYVLDSAGAVHGKWQLREDKITEAVEALLKEMEPVVASGPAR